MRVVTRRGSYEARVSVGLDSMVRPARNEVFRGLPVQPVEPVGGRQRRPEEEPLAGQRRQAPRLGPGLRPGRLQEARGAHRAHLAPAGQMNRRRRLPAGTSGAPARTGGAGGGWLRCTGGRATQAVGGLRPPGALPEEEFLALHPLLPLRRRLPEPRHRGAERSAAGATSRARRAPAEAGTPVIFPRRQACMLCQGVPGDELLCTAACPSGALQRGRARPPRTIRAKVHMGTARVDSQPLLLVQRRELRRLRARLPARGPGAEGRAVRAARSSTPTPASAAACASAPASATRRRFACVPNLERT